ncbi:MAG: hypothetical protein RL358_1155 [Pseudomonadota bacterium]|jgi:predicted nuclease of restriction endonuclease-like (RecB) superfamily
MPKKIKPSQIATLTMSGLIDVISNTHRDLLQQAGKAINLTVTIRNWVIGAYLFEYEQSGEDRAQYGTRLLDAISERLASSGIKGIAPRSLRLYRQFYLTYPNIWQSAIAKSDAHSPLNIWQSAIAKLPNRLTEVIPNSDTSPTFAHTPEKTLFAMLSFTHLAELLQIESTDKRTFYENECIRGTWSVRELKRQIASLYFERTQLSTDKKGIAKLAHTQAEFQPAFAIRDPYIFEFLGLKPQEVMSESHLEDQLLDHLQNFLLELGHGFCFEARQKRILIGENHGFIDLVFYHRILKCHVLIELKLNAFNHESAGQLNTYVTWYSRHMMSTGDNPPIGILLCTEKDHTLAEYALAGMDNQLFVSRYQLELPSKETLERFIQQQLKDA